jgi:D-alanyl-D-alanine carboxypeptidase
MTCNFRFLVFSAVLFIAGAALPRFAMAEDLENQVRDLLGTFRIEYGFPGATVAYALPDGQVGSAATGFADIEAGKAMTSDTRMLAASIGKSFVAATVLGLENDGFLALKAPVSAYLGAEPWFDRLPNHATMTVGDLVRHSAGLADHVHTKPFAAAMAARVATVDDAIPSEAAIEFILDTKPLFPAGSAWAYTDTGYLLLGLIIEKVMGRRYYDIVAERFLKPLDLTQTAPSNRRMIPDLAVGYTIEGNPFGLPPRTMDTQGQLLWDPAVEWTGGGLVSKSRDLAVWGHALFGGMAMSGPYLDQLLDGVPVSPDTPNILYGAGVAIHTETPRGPVYGHGGWVPGYVSSLRHYADHGVTVAFQINTDVGVVDDRTGLVAALETALADLVISGTSE